MLDACVNAVRVCAPRAGGGRCVPGKGRADALTMPVVGDLQSEVGDAWLPADGPDADEGQWPPVGAEPDPAPRLVEQPCQITRQEVSPAPAAQQVRLGALRVEGGDQVPVRRRHQAGLRKGGVRQQGQSARAPSRSARRNAR